MSGLRKAEVAVAVLAAGTLAASVVLGRGAEAAVAGGAVACVIVPWTWPRTADEKLRSRIATTSFAAMAGFAAALFASAPLGAAAVVAVIAAVVAVIAARGAAGLAAAALPAEGEAAGRAVFEGTVHAVGAAETVPGSGLEVVAWVARQGRRRWASTARFEVRSEARRVALEPGQAQIAGAAWVPGVALGRAVTQALEGAKPTRLVRVWSLHEGDRVFVVGRAKLADDPAALGLRDPGRISVFVGDARIGAEAHAAAVRAGRLRVAVAAAVAIAAAAAAVVEVLRHGVGVAAGGGPLG